MQYTNEIFAFKAWPKAQFILLYIDKLQPQKHQRSHNYRQGIDDSWDTLRKATSITTKDTKLGTNKANSSILHIWDYWGINMQQDC
jgi:hypothetical protein